MGARRRLLDEAALDPARQARGQGRDHDLVGREARQVAALACSFIPVPSSERWEWFAPLSLQGGPDEQPR